MIELPGYNPYSMAERAFTEAQLEREAKERGQQTSPYAGDWNRGGAIEESGAQHGMLACTDVIAGKLEHQRTLHVGRTPAASTAIAAGTG